MIKIIPQTESKPKEPEVSFPKLMKYSYKNEPEMLALFLEPKKCLVLNAEHRSKHEIGTIQTYDSQYWTDYNLPITLQNQIESKE